MAGSAASIFVATTLSTACASARCTDASCWRDSTRSAFSFPAAALVASACQVFTGVSTPSLSTVASMARTSSRCRRSQAVGDRPAASLQAASIIATERSKPRTVNGTLSRAR
ncbi:hypothetical protein D3C85_1154520 [compost metagenome]